MDIIYFDPNTLRAQALSLEQAIQTEGILWVDIYPPDTEWEKTVEQLLGFPLYEQHIKDAHNAHHPPFYDATHDYEMLVFRALTHTTLHLGSFQAESSPVVFFISSNVLVSVHTSLKTDCHLLRTKWLRGLPLRTPLSTIGILGSLLGWFTDQYLSIRVPFAQQLEHWQKQLLDPDSRFNDWPSLLQASSQLRHFRMGTVEPQEEALDAFLDETALQLDMRIEVRLRDALEHFTRVSRDTETLQNDLENLVQIYFSATNQRTNEVIRVLTIASVIFLPLNLLAGIYGMNFEHIPGSGAHFGFFEVLAGMMGITIGVLLILHWKRWL
ncbi:magnesium transporter CorA family protein [Thiofilum flexile]|uniref:magnesium transporter CorA family protein n=1 Tax=Thiofilum flexile TaxID=125627 RepID=UPI00039FC47E|nr:magnesium transporter CorA family protein [Thiofilum flexile]